MHSQFDGRSDWYKLCQKAKLFLTISEKIVFLSKPQDIISLLCNANYVKVNEKLVCESSKVIEWLLLFKIENMKQKFHNHEAVELADKW